MKQKSFLKFFIVLLFTSLIVSTGCEKKTDETAQPEKDTLQTDTAKVDTTIADTVKIINLAGTWQGILNERASTFRISEFKDNNIKGTITIKSRGTITREVAGTFNPETRTVRFSDQTRSRDMGRYSGTVSEDGTTITGTFTMNADGSTSKFNYKRAQ